MRGTRAPPRWSTLWTPRGGARAGGPRRGPARARAGVRVLRRGYDARNPRAIMLVYTLDLAVRDEAAVLRRHAGDPRLGPAPDTRYQFVARAPEGAPRPVVIGTGPCGLMAALILAQ